MLAAFPDARRDRGRAWLGGALARVPPAGARRAALDRAAVGGCAAATRSPSSSTRAARSAPARMRRRGCASSFCSSEPRGSVLDVGCGSGVLAIAAAKLGFAPVIAVDVDEAAIEATRANAAANGVEVDARRSTPRRPLPARRPRARQHRARRGRGARARLEAARLVTSGYLVADEPAAREASAAPSVASSTAGRRTLHERLPDAQYDPARGALHVDFLGCKVSHVDAQEIRERLLADGHVEAARRRARRRRGDQHAAASRTRRSRRAARPRPGRRGPTAAST